jgi:hypothetical protein
MVGMIAKRARKIPFESTIETGKAIHFPRTKK